MSAIGRPSTYSEDLANELCDRIPSEPLTDILAEEGMPGYSTVMRWLREHDDFREKYTRAREDQGDHDADLVAGYRERVARGEMPPDVGRVVIDSCKWTAGKRKAKAYGDRMAVEHEGLDGLGESLKLGRERIASPKD